MKKKTVMSKNARIAIAIIAVVAGIAFFAVAITFAAIEEKTKGPTVIVASDIHVVAAETLTKEKYDAYKTSEKAKQVSEAALRTMGDDIAKAGADYLLISGDLTEFGDEASHKAVASILKTAKARGIKVFVINGNHDVDVAGDGVRLSQAKFREIYKDFGYGESKAKYYEGTLSYATDLDETHKLIAVDNIGYMRDDGTRKEEMDDAHRLWIYDRIDECEEEGKEPIIIAHKPFMNHLPEIIEAFSNNGYNSMLEYFAKHGANLVFVGHMHFNDIKQKTFTVGEDEKKSVYEIMSSCLAMYDGSYREVALGKKRTTINNLTVKRIEGRYLPEFCSDEEVALLTEDYPAYAEKQLRLYMDNLYKGITDDGAILGFGLPPRLSELDGVWKIIKTDVIKRCVNTPYYIEDEQDGISLQRVLEGFGIDLPETEYRCFSDFANDALTEVIEGNRNFTDENFSELFKYTLYEIVWMLDDASDRINAILEEKGYEARLNIDCERLFREGELECYDSGIMPFVCEAAKKAFGDISLGIISMEKMINLLSNDLSYLETDFIKTLINGYTGNKIAGYEEYIELTYIDFGGLIDEGILGTYLADYINEPPIKGNYAVIEK